MITQAAQPSPAQKSYEGVLLGLSVVARIACVLLGAFSLFGLLFFGALTPAMLAGGFAFAAAVIPASRPSSNDQRSTAILTLAVLGLMCQIADVAAYYWLHNISGNYYWWPGSIAYFGALTLMAAFGAVTRTRQSHVV